jgi:hypothetical protein
MVDFSSIPETGQLAGLAGTLEWARKNLLERHLCQNRRQQAWQRPAVLRERNVGHPSVLPGQSPLGLAVPYQENPLYRHTPRVLMP